MGLKINTLLVCHLQNINRTKKPIDDNTVYKTILRNNDGMGGMNSSDLYKLLVKNAIKTKNRVLKAWPINWLDLSVSELSKRLA